MSKATTQNTNDVEEIDYLELDQIIENEFNGDKENLIMILQAIQRRYNYLPRASLLYVSEKLDIPYSKIYEVGTFYSTFSLEPRGRNIVSICLGTACHVRGGERVREQIEDTLDIKDGETAKNAFDRYGVDGIMIGRATVGRPWIFKEIKDTSMVTRSIG